MKRSTRTCTALVLTTVLSVSLVSPASAAEADYSIDNPYAEVNWTAWGQYKSGAHNHSYESDGGNTAAERFEDAYAKDFDIFALTDHNFTNTSWDRTDRPESNARGPLTYLTSERLEEMKAGEGRDGRGILPVTNSNEQSRSDHLLTYWADFNNASGATLEGNIAQAEELGGVSVVAHPGRYTGGRGNTGSAGIVASSKPETVKKYVDLFTKYDSSVGMEIINKKDGDSASDRILWDNVLTEMMPGDPVWGYSNDDAHSNSALGFSYNMHLMPELTEDAFRHSMETGAFYASAKVANRELGGDFVSEGMTPTISNIVVDDNEDTISITGVDTESVRWISEGQVIAEGAEIDLDDYIGKAGAYVRAELVGPGGITFTQPFGLNGGPEREKVEVSGFDLNSSQQSIAPGESLKLDAVATDAQGQLVDLSGHTVAYSADSDMLQIAADGTVTVASEPLVNMPVRVTATALVDGKVYTDSVQLMINVGSTDSYTVSPIRTGNDDIEEYVSDGRIYFDSSDLEISNEDSTGQAIGLRFADLAIPAGAEISKAYVQFTVDEPDKSTDVFHMEIKAENTGNSAPFGAEAYNLTARDFFEDGVAWADIPLWTVDGAAGEDQRTSDLSSLLQQVVDREDWAEGNALTLKIEGEGNRSADAFESNAAPVLHVLWSMPEPETQDSEGEREAVVDFEVKSNNGRFLHDSEAKVAALEEVNYSTGRVVSVERKFGSKHKSFEVIVETATKSYTVTVEAETGEAKTENVTER